jgi:hypothetical protein
VPACAPALSRLFPVERDRLGRLPVDEFMRVRRMANVVTKGAAAKQTKQLINCQRIYPPSTCNRQEILAAAAPGVQQPPRT